MIDIDCSKLRHVVEDGPHPLFATISGAHLYGFPSPDSDVDLRGAFVLPVSVFLRLREPNETINVTKVFEGTEVDWVAHDIRKFARMMTRRNGYVLEQLYSPLVVYGGTWLDELRAIGRGCITRQLFYHYRGFADTQLKLLAGSAPTTKMLLYAYRVLLTGTHIMRSGNVEANLRVLAQHCPALGIDELVERKINGVEGDILVWEELPAHLERLRRLYRSLEDTFQASTLPEIPSTITALDDFIVRVRLEITPNA